MSRKQGADGGAGCWHSGSLSRLDYYLNDGDNYSFSSKAYKVMSDIAIANGDDFGLDTTHEAHYRRWLNSSKSNCVASPACLAETVAQLMLLSSRAETNNPAWYNMPPSAILTTGAASFVGRCYANGTYGAGVSSHLTQWGVLHLSLYD